METPQSCTSNELASSPVRDIGAVADNLCEICQDNESKYKCPKCALKTCSLPCVKKHKIEKNCDGVRCRTDYIPLSDFNENHMLSDYRFLEEISRCSSNSRILNVGHKDKQVKKMRQKVRCAKEMNINLKILPKNFTKHRHNSTYYHNKQKKIYWNILFNFSKCCLSLHKRSICDSLTLSGILQQKCQQDFIENPQLEVYKDCKNINFYMKRLDLPSNQCKYDRLARERTLRENLKGKTIVEYPEILVVLAEDSGIYDQSAFEKESTTTPDTVLNKKRSNKSENLEISPPKIFCTPLQNLPPKSGFSRYNSSSNGDYNSTLNTVETFP